MAEEVKGAADYQPNKSGNPAANHHSEGRGTSAPRGQADDGRGGGGNAQAQNKDESHHTNHNVGQARRKLSLPGHEGFVRPSSYLRHSRGLSTPMHPPKQQQQETVVDREQRDGLFKSGACSARCLASITPLFHIVLIQGPAEKDS